MCLVSGYIIIQRKRYFIRLTFLLFVFQILVGAQPELNSITAGAFSVTVFTMAGQLKHLYLYGVKEIIAKYENVTAKTVIEVLLGAYKVFQTAPPPAYEYLIDFLNYTILEIPISVTTRNPKKGLMDFIRTEYSVM